MLRISSLKSERTASFLHRQYSSRCSSADEPAGEQRGPCVRCDAAAWVGVQDTHQPLSGPADAVQTPVFSLFHITRCPTSLRRYKKYTKLEICEACRRKTRKPLCKTLRGSERTSVMGEKATLDDKQHTHPAILAGPRGPHFTLGSVTKQAPKRNPHRGHPGVEGAGGPDQPQLHQAVFQSVLAAFAGDGAPGPSRCPGCGVRDSRGAGGVTPVTPAQPRHHAGPGREVWIPGTPDSQKPWLSWDHSPSLSRALGSQDRTPPSRALESQDLLAQALRSQDSPPPPPRALGSQDLPAQALGSYRQQPVNSRIARNASQDRAGINACFVLPEMLVEKAISHQQEYVLSWYIFILGLFVIKARSVYASKDF